MERKNLEDYQGVRDKLLKEFSPKEDLSESAIDSALKTAVFGSVDIPKRRHINPVVRLDKALEELWEFLNRPPEEYECYIEVGGLNVASLPASFGCVRFVVFNAYQLQKLKKPFRTKRPKDLSSKLEAINTAIKPLLNRPTAIVKVDARDKQAAKALAERKVRAVVECLNFFSDLIPNNYIGLFLPIERKSNSINGFTIATRSGFISTFGAFMDTGLPSGGFSIAKLRQSKSPTVCRAVKRLGSLLKESKNACERKELMKKIKKLYGIRSNIVHSGHYEVTEEKYNEVYNIAKSIILKLLANRYVKGFSSLEEFENWLKELSLK